MSFTALGGKQRRYWEHNSAWLWGADAEWNISEAFPRSFGGDYGLTVGFSYVGKHEKETLVMTDDNAFRLRLPETTAAFDGRVNLKLKDFSILAEAATKNNEPSADNNYTYRRGSAFMLSGAYSSKGFSALLQAKRSDNMSWRSDRDMTGVSSFINHLPAFTMTQTYALAAMYPYATHLTANGLSRARCVILSSAKPRWAANMAQACVCRVAILPVLTATILPASLTSRRDTKWALTAMVLRSGKWANFIMPMSILN